MMLEMNMLYKDYTMCESSEDMEKVRQHNSDTINRLFVSRQLNPKVKDEIRANVYPVVSFKEVSRIVRL